MISGSCTYKKIYESFTVKKITQNWLHELSIQYNSATFSVWLQNLRNSWFICFLILRILPTSNFSVNLCHNIIWIYWHSRRWILLGATSARSLQLLVSWVRCRPSVGLIEALLKAEKTKYKVLIDLLSQPKSIQKILDSVSVQQP